MNSSKLLKLLVPAVLVLACGDSGTEPGDGSVSVAVQSGDAQFALPSTSALDPLQVVVTDARTKDPVEGATVTWSVVTGNGALLTPASSTTDENGVATTSVRVGSALGEYIVEARGNKLIGEPARFRIRAVEAPVIGSAPAVVNTGDTITLTGSNFSTQGDDNIVLFGGFRGKVLSATTTQLRVVVPVCVPNRVVTLTTSLGAVASAPRNVEVRGSNNSALQLARGEVRTASDPAELGCFHLPGGISGYTVLLVPQNYSDIAGTSAALQLAGLTGGPVITNIAERAGPAPTTSRATVFEAGLRLRERDLLHQIGTAPNARPDPQMSSIAACPSPARVGDRCSFQVINKDDKFTSVSAELKAISDRALIYADVKSPSNGLSTGQYQELGRTFDDPIHGAVTGAFGAPSDIDGNSKVVILLTPVVNELTPRNSSGFIAGFFYGCDLVSRSVCSGSNGGEIFYTLTADPGGQFGDARSVQLVLRSLPPVLGHEFQHMIHFGQRKSTDALWLSEGLAHHAEDIVADVYAARGDATSAAQFRAQNYSRAIRYLRSPKSTSLVAENGNGTLELRGAAWLFVKYLVGQHGESILRTLTQSTESSVTNVVRQTGRSWSSLLANWAIALYADDAPELANARLEPQHTFPNINMRAAFGGPSGYPFRPDVESYRDFSRRETLPASSQAYVILQASGTTSQPFSLNLSGPLGGNFSTNAAPQLSILRIQ